MISLIVSSNRPNYWSNFEKNFYCDLINEIIFVGPINNSKKLDQRSKFIKSYFKPVQCLVQGISKAKNNFFFFAPDDIYCSAETLDLYLRESINNFKNKVILVPRFFMDKREMTNGLKFRENDDFMIPVFSILSKEIYEEIGGFDKNFIAVLYDIDFYLRLFYYKGFRSKLIKNFKIYELPQSVTKGNLSKDFWIKDRKFLDSLWVFEKKEGYIRNRPINSFEINSIDSLSQGSNVLKWSKNNNLFLLINDFFLVRIIKSLKNKIRDFLYSAKKKLLNE